MFVSLIVLRRKRKKRKEKEVAYPSQDRTRRTRHMLSSVCITRIVTVNSKAVVKLRLHALG